MYLTLDEIIMHIRQASSSGQSVKVGIAISGGGVRGAYSAGAAEAILRKLFADPAAPIRPSVITATSVGAIVAAGVLADLMYSELPTGDLYASRQSWIWRKISDGNNGNAVVGGEREWFLDLLSNKKVPVIAKLFLALEQMNSAVTEVSSLAGKLKQGFDSVQAVVQAYPEGILKEKHDLLATIIHLSGKVNPEKITNQFREMNKEVLGVLKGRYEEIPGRLMGLGRKVIGDFARDVTSFQASFQQLCTDLEQLASAVGSVAPLVDGVRKAIELWPGIAAHVGGSLATLQSLGNAGNTLLQTLPELRALGENYFKFINILFDPDNSHQGIGDHLIGNKQLRSLVRDFLNQVIPEADKERPGKALIEGWQQQRKAGSTKTPPEFILTASDLTTYNQLNFALADISTLDVFNQRQILTADITKSSNTKPSNAYVLHPKSQGNDVLMDAIFTSSAYPVAFPPQRWEFAWKGTTNGQTIARQCVDGGICNNTPIDLASMTGATHIISLELNPLVTGALSTSGTEDYNMFTVLGPLLETSLASALRNNISALVSESRKQNRHIYRLAPLRRPIEGEFGDDGKPAEDPTPKLFDFGGRYSQKRGLPGHLLMSIYDWFMQGYLDAMGYPNTEAALTAHDPVVLDYYQAPGTRGYRRGSVMFGNKFWHAVTKALPEELPTVARGRGKGQFVSLRSKNFPSYYVAHQNWEVKITDDMGSDLMQSNASFAIVDGLADPSGVSFESINYPGYYLRHSNYVLRLDRAVDTALYRDDATFYQRTGLADPGMASFQSKNFPDRYIRHSYFKLRVDPDSGGPFKEDATFFIVDSLK
jgi:predicted acylesterase/phospholipase RssA